MKDRIKKIFTILLALTVVMTLVPTVAFAAETDDLCAHPGYSTETVSETCTTQGYDIHSCTACDYSYIEYHSYSEWSAERPTGIDDALIQTATQYRSADKDVKISSESAMDGYTLVETTCNSGRQETNDYAVFDGTGFSVTNELHEKYCHPVSAFEDESGKIVLDSEAVTGYLYYHWCYTDSYYAVEASSGSYTTFHAYYDTTSPDTYTCDSSDMSYQTSHSSCSDTDWWYVLDVNTQSYMVYDRVNVF